MMSIFPTPTPWKTMHVFLFVSFQSVSSEDSFDSARINKFFEAPKREAKPWWDDDEENGTIGSGISCIPDKEIDDFHLITHGLDEKRRSQM